MINDAERKLIAKYSAMDIDTLGRHISQNIVHYKSDYLVNAFSAIFSSPTENRSPIKYPKIYEGSSEYVRYISDVQTALCNDQWLCKKMESIAKLPYEEQIVQISHAISTNAALENWRVSPLPVAVLITKISAKRFCDCE